MMGTMDAGMELGTPDPPPHATPACNPLRCLTSLMHIVISKPHLHGLNLPEDFCHSLLRLDPEDGSAVIPGCGKLLQTLVPRFLNPKPCVDAEE